ncbi:hypothetical protein CI109_101500 [Kwoniella shandongensis]|uniref:Uncharacterized protein n=1 Tax=Kwoniella shandongensis TaxID=1734106 RepID=A0A5M6C6Q4_9TREE|nr:uncharacterized protein CI109_001907 [Kwoniella shandongensis]KAA5529482.1 hypothetical protein CI109_001907 [Kwoniella shandongensis]
MTALVEHRAFLSTILDRQASRRKLIDPETIFPLPPPISGRPPPGDDLSTISHNNVDNGGSESSNSVAGPSKTKMMVVNYVKEEETIRNDYSEWYGVSGEFGSNYVMGARDQEICEEYPALKKLMTLKSQLVETTSHPPLYLHLSIPSPPTILSSLSPARFDVILINPFAAFPSSSSAGIWESTASLQIRQLSSDPGFVFLWVGKGDEDGLERGRECFAKWGFRRAEDIVWVKTNKASQTEEEEGGGGGGGGGLFASQKEHCLMGIRGTVRRSTDMRFVHCNVDTDVLVWEEDDSDAAEAAANKPSLPPYLYTLIENFCLGTRRLELFGSTPRHARRGWVTAGLDPLPTEAEIPTATTTTSTVLPFDPTTYPSLLSESDGRPILPYHTEIDSLRPKSPQRRPRNLPGGAGGGGGMSSGRPSPAQTPNFRPSPQFGQTQSFSSQSQGGNGGRMSGVNQQQQQQYFQQQQQQQMLQQQQQQQAMYAQMMAMNGGMGMGMPLGMGMGMMNPMGMGMGMPFAAQGGVPGFLGQQPMGMGMGMGVNGGQPGNWQMGFPNPDMGMGGYDGQQQIGQGGYGQGQGQGQGQGGGMGWQSGWQ